MRPEQKPRAHLGRALPRRLRGRFSNALLLLCLPACALSIPASAQGPGDLTVTPTRAVFEGRERSQSISLINRAAAAATYRITFIRMRMSEDGRFEEIDEPAAGERFADRMIRYFPRQVTLEPGEAQTVRLMLRKPAELATGEYRSHLLLHAVPSDAGNSIETAQAAGEELSVRLRPIYRIAVPVIVRHGELAARADLTDLRLDGGQDRDASPELAFRIRREGDRSLYGDVSVTFVPDGGGTVSEVGRIDGLAVYVPNAARAVTLPLRLPDGVVLRGGRLKVVFSEAPDTGSAATAASELPLS